MPVPDETDRENENHSMDCETLVHKSIMNDCWPLTSHIVYTSIVCKCRATCNY